MDDLRQILSDLPDVPPGAEERVWARVRRTRERRAVPWLGFAVLGAGLAVAALALALRPEAVRVLEIDAGPRADTWSATVGLETDGTGTVTGTSRELEVAWSAGTVRASVEPGSGTRLAVRTDEAVVAVVGTVFDVTRDRLGTTASVSRGEIEVRCAGRAPVRLRPESGSHTCAPLTAAGLLARADALEDGGSDAASILDALDAGLAVAEPGSAARGELLARRMAAHGSAGRVPQALADAHAYLDGPAPRAHEVRRYAGRLAWSNGDCATARLHLDALGEHASPEDRVALAECLGDEVARARELLDAALPSLDPSWTTRARAARAALEAR